MTLREVKLGNPTATYAAEFFGEVAKQPAGKFFSFDKKLPETTIRSQAQIFSKALGVKFTVVTVTKANEAGEGGSFAVGVTTKERKPRERKAVSATTIVPEDSPAIPTPGGVIEVAASEWPIDPLPLGGFIVGDVEAEHDGPSTSDVELAQLPAAEEGV